MSRLDFPLRFERVYIEKVWGGRALERHPGIELPDGVTVGETWEIVDRRDQNSVVRGGPLAGQRFEQVMAAHGADLLGRAKPNCRGRFPLLIKYLDASQNLSVQVHPDDAIAERMGGDAEGKTEAWYILDSSAGGSIYCGLAPGVARAELQRALEQGDPVPSLAKHPVDSGMSVTVPGGTVHAIGAGVTLLEVQQNSNTTYRLYDWDRLGLDGQPREIHVAEALEATAYEHGTEVPRGPRYEDLAEGVALARLSSTEYFSMRRLTLSGPFEQDTDGQFLVLVVVGGSGTLTCPTAPDEPLQPGDVLLLPAALGTHALAPDAGGLDLVLLDANA